MIDPRERARLEQVAGRDVSRGTMAKLEAYAALLAEESRRHNLVSASTLDHLWERHVLDSAQLAALAPDADMSWADIGSGAGLPGIVVALLTDGPMLLIEPRRLRAEFLGRALRELGLDARVAVAAEKAERVTGRFDVITARAVAPLDKLLALSTHLSTRKTLWLLPKGRSAQSELAEARRHWHCDARIVPSCTGPGAGIVVLRNVKARDKR